MPNQKPTKQTERAIPSVAWEKLSYKPDFTERAVSFRDPWGMPTKEFTLFLGWIYYWDKQTQSWYRTHPDFAIERKAGSE